MVHKEEQIIYVRNGMRSKYCPFRCLHASFYIINDWMTINFLDPHNWMLCISGLTPWPAQQQHQEDSSSKQQHQQVSSSNNNVSIKQSIAAYKMQALYKYIQQSSSSCSRPAATSTQWQANKHAASSTYSTHTQPARREDGGMARPDLAESLCKITKWGPLPVQVPIFVLNFLQWLPFENL